MNGLQWFDFGWDTPVGDIGWFWLFAAALFVALGYLVRMWQDL